MTAPRAPLRRKPPTGRPRTARCSVLRCMRSPYHKDLLYCGTHLLERIDAEARRRVFERDGGRCQDDRAHACRGPLQWAHLLSRSYSGVRHLLDNGVVLCAGAHTYYTTRPIQWQEFCLRRLGAERWDDLERLALEVASGRAKFDLAQTGRNYGVIV